MRNIFKREEGLVTLESAMFLPFMAALLFVLVEGVNSIQAYSTIAEASRSAARHIALTGETAGASSFVKTLIKELPPEAITTAVTVDPVSDKVTVEVRYEYDTFFSVHPDEEKDFDGIITLKAKTTMPMP